MIDLSTINASTIAQPQTLEAVRAEVQDIRSLGDASRASVLLSYLERQLPSSASDPIRGNYQEVLTHLKRLAGENANEENSDFIAEEHARVAVRDRSGKVQMFSNGRFQNPEEQQQKLRERPSTPPSFRKTIGNMQNSAESRVAHQTAPVSFDVPEDEEEIRAHSSRLSGLQLGKQEQNHARLVESLIAKHQLTFTDELMKKRFATVVISRIKEIRNDKEAKEILSRSAKVGGLGFSEEQSEAIIYDLQHGAEMMEEDLGEVHPQQKHGTQQPAPPAPSKVLPHLAAGAAQAPSAKVIPVPAAPRAVTQAEPSKKPRSILPKRHSLGVNGRPTVEDIKTPARRLVGPVEELQHLSVEDFRSWGSTPAEAVRKVYEKISVLGQESFGKRVEGVQAWRQSPVHQLYLNMMRESLEKGLDISKLSDQWKEQQKSALTAPEFHAIVDLNTKLRF